MNKLKLLYTWIRYGLWAHMSFRDHQLLDTIEAELELLPKQEPWPDILQRHLDEQLMEPDPNDNLIIVRDCSQDNLPAMLAQLESEGLLIPMPMHEEDIEEQSIRIANEAIAKAQAHAKDS